MPACPKCGQNVAGLRSALQKQKREAKRLRAEIGAHRDRRFEAVRQRDEMATQLVRARRREAALKHSYEELRFKHERAQETIHKILNPL